MTPLTKKEDSDRNPDFAALLTVEEAYAADKAAMQSGIDGATLMENAGAAVEVHAAGCCCAVEE